MCVCVCVCLICMLMIQYLLVRLMGQSTLLELFLLAFLHLHYSLIPELPVDSWVVTPVHSS